MIRRLLSFFRKRRAWKAGTAASDKWVDDVETRWAEFAENARGRLDAPGNIRAMFIGWLSGLNEEVLEMCAATHASPTDLAKMWQAFVTRYTDRLHSEVLSHLPPSSAEEIFSHDDATKAAKDIDVLVDELMQSVAGAKEAALDQVVRSVRDAERTGSLAPDERSDEEIKQSIREMWEG